MNDKQDEQAAREAFEEWWNNEGEGHFGDDPQTKRDHCTSFINGYLMGLGDR